MCMDSPDPPPPPPAPPPPPPVLEQEAPKTNMATAAEQAERRASGTKRYRTSGLGIESTSTSSTSAGGLNIPL